MPASGNTLPGSLGYSLSRYGVGCVAVSTHSPCSLYHLCTCHRLLPQFFHRQSDVDAFAFPKSYSFLPSFHGCNHRTRSLVYRSRPRAPCSSSSLPPDAVEISSSDRQALPALRATTAGPGWQGRTCNSTRQRLLADAGQAHQTRCRVTPSYAWREYHQGRHYGGATGRAGHHSRLDGICGRRDGRRHNGLPTLQLRRDQYACGAAGAASRGRLSRGRRRAFGAADHHCTPEPRRCQPTVTLVCPCGAWPLTRQRRRAYANALHARSIYAAQHVHCVRTPACALHSHAVPCRAQALPTPVRAVLPARMLWLADDPFGRQVFGAVTMSVLLNGTIFWLWARQRRRLGMQKPLWKGAKWEL